MIVAQLFLAAMFVFEEKILKNYNTKVMEIVGWEGIWRSIISLIYIYVFYNLPGDDMGSAENPFQALFQIKNNTVLFISIILSSFVIGPFNYFGTMLTKEASAMHRCLVDASRMCLVWFISLCCAWESFNMYQVSGYAMIILGNLLYNEILLKEEKYFLYKDNETKKLKENDNSNDKKISLGSEDELNDTKNTEISNENILVIDKNE